VKNSEKKKPEKLGGWKKIQPPIVKIGLRALFPGRSVRLEKVYTLEN